MYSRSPPQQVPGHIPRAARDFQYPRTILPYVVAQQVEGRVVRAGVHVFILVRLGPFIDYAYGTPIPVHDSNVIIFPMAI